MEVQRAKKAAKAKAGENGRQAEAAVRKAEKEARAHFDMCEHCDVHQLEDEDTDEECDD